jgi:hypothetical protein
MATSFQEDGPTPHPQANAAGPKTMTDLLALADAERTLVNWLVRQRGASLAEIAMQLHHPLEEAEAMVEALIELGFLTADASVEPTVFKPNLVSHRPRAVPGSLWDALSQ